MNHTSTLIDKRFNQCPINNSKILVYYKFNIILSLTFSGEISPSPFFHHPNFRFHPCVPSFRIQQVGTFVSNFFHKPCTTISRLSATRLSQTRARYLIAQVRLQAPRIIDSGFRSFESILRQYTAPRGDQMDLFLREIVSN